MAPIAQARPTRVRQFARPDSKGCFPPDANESNLNTCAFIASCRMPVGLLPDIWRKLSLRLAFKLDGSVVSPPRRGGERLDCREIRFGFQHLLDANEGPLWVWLMRRSLATYPFKKGKPRLFRPLRSSHRGFARDTADGRSRRNRMKGQDVSRL